MRRLRLLGCVLAVLLATVGTAVAVNNHFHTHAKGDEEVPPRATLAQGQVQFRLSDDGTELHYKLIAANIENVFQAHIHLGAPGTNGPIVVWLFPSTAPVPGPLGAGRTDGVLAEGTITAADLVNNLAGHPLSDLVDAIRAGNTYINIHTNDGMAPINTGPGDFPGGEVRGQLN